MYAAVMTAFQSNHCGVSVENDLECGEWFGPNKTWGLKCVLVAVTDNKINLIHTDSPLQSLVPAQGY